MKKLKSNKKRLIILIVIIILFIVGLTTFIIKSDIFKNKNNIETTENNQESNDINNNLESDKNDYEKPEENNTSDVENNVDEKEDNITKPNDKEEKPTNNGTTNNISNNTNNNKPNNTENKPSSDNNNNENTSNKPETEEKPEEEPVTPPVVEDKNDTKRKNMENIYGIKILYGDEIGDYHPRGITPTRLTNESDIETYLTKLNGELAKYPKGFFNDFKKKGMPLTIYLVKGVNGAFAGFTDYQFRNDIKLTLVTNYNFEYTIHHELMHYIDCYLDIVMYPSEQFSEYEALNPNGFVYGNATEDQIYNMASNTKGAYFITSYGASNVREDRAEVFKFMTARAYKPAGCFEPNETIRKKAEIISKQIKTYFPSVTGSAIWDRFIK